ncbi:MAG: type II toxin-antitoxin system RelE/ParE family toxin [Pseudomonadota bacterium]
MHLSISEASIYLGVSCCTLWRWDKSNKLNPDSLTPGEHRRYSISNLKSFSGDVADGENKKVIAYVKSLDDLKSPPNLRLERLKGDLVNFYSIRINDQWRVVFLWTPSGPMEVKIVDYH